MTNRSALGVLVAVAAAVWVAGCGQTSPDASGTAEVSALFPGGEQVTLPSMTDSQFRHYNSGDSRPDNALTEMHRLGLVSVLPRELQLLIRRPGLREEDFRAGRGDRERGFIFTFHDADDFSVDDNTLPRGVRRDDGDSDAWVVTFTVPPRWDLMGMGEIEGETVHLAVLTDSGELSDEELAQLEQRIRDVEERTARGAPIGPAQM